MDFAPVGSPHQLYHRYTECKIISTALNPDEDFLGLIHGLTSKSVVEGVLRERHPMPNRKISLAASEIKSYVAQGLRFVDQARSGPRVISFLPYYYAFLQFAKAEIVARHPKLDPKNMLHHGLSYSPAVKDSQSLDTEIVKVYPKGVFTSYYEVLTKKTFPTLTQIKMKDVYPFIVDASSEYEMATGCPFLFKNLRFFKNEHGSLQVHPSYNSSPESFLEKEYKRNKSTGAFQKNPLHSILPMYLLYHSNVVNSDDFWYSTPIRKGRLQYPEEIPLYLIFFHLGSIVRYKPRFMEKMMDSKYLPFLLATERHCSFKFFQLFYNFMMQCNYFITTP